LTTATVDEPADPSARQANPANPAPASQAEIPDQQTVPRPAPPVLVSNTRSPH